MEGKRGYAHIHRPSGDAQADPTVLGHAFFRNIEAGHDLEARDDQPGQAAGRRHHLPQHAVDTKPDRQPLLERLQVDIRGPFANGLCQHAVDQADDRRVVFALEQVGRLGQILGQARQVEIVTQVFGSMTRGGIVSLVQLGDKTIVIRRQQPLDAHPALETSADLLKRGYIDRLAHHQTSPTVAVSSGHPNPALARKAVGRPKLTGHRCPYHPGCRNRPIRPA